MFGPQRRAMVLSMPVTTSPVGSKAPGRWMSSLRARTCEIRCASLRTSWKRPKLGRSARPITRKALSVRWPGASTAPATRTSTRRQTGTVKQSRNGTSQMAGRDGTGRVPGETAAGVRLDIIESEESNDARVASRADTSLIRGEAPSPGHL